ncbi:MAG: TVP38/TMEM64 family protein [Pirellulales bacterium]
MNAGSTKAGGVWRRILVLGLVVLAVVAGYLTLDLQQLASRENELRQFQDSHPVLVYAVAFLAYVLVAGLSLPGATLLTLILGWYFKFLPTVILVSFASTTGATVAFLLSRYLFRQSLKRKFATQYETFNCSFDQEGSFYLFALRLVPAIPFFVINVGMGLTRIRVWTYWWVSQLGMLAATIVYTYAGAQIPNLQTLADRGVLAAFTGLQMLQFAIAFTLLGLLPLVLRFVSTILRR